MLFALFNKSVECMYARQIAYIRQVNSKIKVVCVLVQLLKLISERSNQHFNSFLATQRRILCDSCRKRTHRTLNQSLINDRRNSSPRGYKMRTRKLTPFENGVQLEIKSLPSLRLSSFIVSEDIISIL